MFRFFESFLSPTGAPDAAAARPVQPPEGLVPFYWHFISQAKPLFAALFVAGFGVSVLDASVPWFIGRLVRAITATPAGAVLRREPDPARRHGGGGAARAPGRHRVAEHDLPRRHHGQRDQHDPLAEPSARGAAELALLPERLRRPHRVARDGHGPGRPPERHRLGHGHLGHRGLRRDGADGAGPRRRRADDPHPGLVLLLRGRCSASSCPGCATAPSAPRR